MHMDFILLAAQTTDSGTKMEIGDAAITAVFGYAVVFFGLVLLMCVLYITGAVFKSQDAKTKAREKAVLENVKKEVEAAPRTRFCRSRKAPRRTRQGGCYDNGYSCR